MRVSKCLMTLVLGAMFWSCKGVDPVAAESSPASQACFEKLHPGEINKGKIESVSYLHGQCKDGFHALNKMSIQEKVYLDQGGDVEASDLFVKDKKVMVDSGDDMLQIGELTKADDGSPTILLKEGVRLSLLVGDSAGDLKAWSYGDSMHKYKVERIVLIVD